jgi:hypothetical protein
VPVLRHHPPMNVDWFPRHNVCPIANPI